MKHKTRKALNIPGHAHELTISTKNRLQFFNNSLIAEYFIANLSIVRETHQLDILAYVVMPEHCHMLVYPNQEIYSISTILTDIKSPVSKFAFANFPEFREQCSFVRPSKGIEYQFWQPGGGYDRNMWSDEAIQNSIAYIHNNPVKRGLCSAPEDWKWSSASNPLL